jgi:hypothetical protein
MKRDQFVWTVLSDDELDGVAGGGVETLLPQIFNSAGRPFRGDPVGTDRTPYGEWARNDYESYERDFGKIDQPPPAPRNPSGLDDDGFMYDPSPWMAGR